MMINEADIIEVRRVATLMLMIDPDDAEAARLLKQAKSKGAQRAEILVKQARSGATLRYREKLIRARRLDPSGQHGKRAREMLQGS